MMTEDTHTKNEDYIALLQCYAVFVISKSQLFHHNTLFLCVAYIAHMFTTDGSMLRLSDIFLIIAAFYEILKSISKEILPAAAR